MMFRNCKETSASTKYMRFWTILNFILGISFNFIHFLFFAMNKNLQNRNGFNPFFFNCARNQHHSDFYIIFWNCKESSTTKHMRHLIILNFILVFIFIFSWSISQMLNGSCEFSPWKWRMTLQHVLPIDLRHFPI